MHQEPVRINLRPEDLRQYDQAVLQAALAAQHGVAGGGRSVQPAPARQQNGEYVEAGAEAEAAEMATEAAETAIAAATASEHVGYANSDGHDGNIVEGSSTYSPTHSRRIDLISMLHQCQCGNLSCAACTVQGAHTFLESFPLKLHLQRVHFSQYYEDACFDRDAALNPKFRTACSLRARPRSWSSSGRGAMWIA